MAIRLNFTEWFYGRNSMIALYIFLNVIPKIDPRKANYEKFSKAFMMMNNGVLLLLFVGNIDIITSGLDITYSLIGCLNY